MPLKACTIWLLSVLCLVAQSCPTLCDPKDCSPPGSSVHGDSPGKNTEMGCHALFQGIFPTQGSNPGLLHCRWILDHWSHYLISKNCFPHPLLLQQLSVSPIFPIMECGRMVAKMLQHSFPPIFHTLWDVTLQLQSRGKVYFPTLWTWANLL